MVYGDFLKSWLMKVLVIVEHSPFTYIFQISIVTPITSKIKPTLVNQCWLYRQNEIIVCAKDKILSSKNNHNSIFQIQLSSLHKKNKKGLVFRYPQQYADLTTVILKVTGIYVKKTNP